MPPRIFRFSELLAGLVADTVIGFENMPSCFGGMANKVDCAEDIIDPTTIERVSLVFLLMI
jgi:hypothetical protein